MAVSDYKIKNTVGMFNFYKGIAMLVVMFGHTEGIFQGIRECESLAVAFARYNVLVVLYGIFHLAAMTVMPSLLIISGYGFRKSTTRECIKKQFKQLVKPYAIAVLITAFMVMAAKYYFWRNRSDSIKAALGTILGGALGMTEDTAIMGHEILKVGPLWFFLALAIGNIIFNFLVHFFEGKKLFGAVVVTTLAGWFLSANVSFNPWCIFQGFVSVLFIWIGYLAKKKKFFMRLSTMPPKAKLLYIPIALLALATPVFGSFNMFYSKYDLLGIVSSCLIGFLIVYFFLGFNRFDGPVISVIREIGAQSLYILCIHSIERSSFGGYGQEIFVNNWQGSYALRTLVLYSVRVATVVILTYCFVWIKRHISEKYAHNDVK